MLPVVSISLVLLLVITVLPLTVNMLPDVPMGTPPIYTVLLLNQAFDQ